MDSAVMREGEANRAFARAESDMKAAIQAESAKVKTVYGTLTQAAPFRGRAYNARWLKAPQVRVPCVSACVYVCVCMHPHVQLFCERVRR